MVDYNVNADGYLEYLHTPTNSKMPVVAPIEITGGYLTRLIDDQEAILQNLLTEVLNLKALEGNTKNVQLISAQATTLNSILTQLQGLRSDVQASGGGDVTVDLSTLESLVGTILNDEFPLLRQLNTDIRNRIPLGDFPVALNLAQKSLLDNIVSLLTSIQASNVGIGVNSDDILSALDEVNTWLDTSTTKITNIDNNLQGLTTTSFPSILSRLDTLVTNTELLLGSGMANIEETILETIGAIASNLVYVSPLGDDGTNTGVELSPFRSIARALTKLGTMTGVKGIKLLPGKYTEICPLVIPRDVAIIGDNSHQVIIEPTLATKNNHILLIDSGTLISNITFSGHDSGKFAIALNGLANNVSIGATNTGAYILRVPCVHNCQVVTSPNGSVIEGSIIDSGSAGGAIEVDGNKCASNSPTRSIAIYNLKVIALNGEGCLVKNDGQIHLYSCESNFAQYHVKATTGGLALLQENKTHFGTKGLIADGVSPTPLFTGLLNGTINQSTVAIRSLSTSRIGNPKPYMGMILRVGGVNYRILSVETVTGGYDLTIATPLSATHAMASASFLRASTIISNSHFFHFVGAGNDYGALPENGGEAIPDNEKEELSGGRIICNSFNSEGDVNINNRIFVDGTTGEVTIGEITVNFPPDAEGLTLYRYNVSDRKFNYNDSSSALDGWTNLALSVNPHDMTEHDFRLLSEKISSGGVYQLYVDIDNPSASDAKNNRGNSPLRPFRTLERALLEASRRSFSKGDDIYNRVSIYVAPGIYDLNNGFGGATDATYYHRYQDAATLVLKNRNSIVDLAYAQFNFVAQDSLALRRRLKEEILYAVNAITEDLSAIGNRATATLGRSYVANRNLNPGEAGFTLANFLNTFYYGLYLDTHEPLRSNSLISSLINGLYLVRDEAIKAMRNQGAIVDNTIVVDDDVPACANVASTISTLIDILTKTLVGEISPYAININMGTALSVFLEDGESSPLALQAFNDPINAGIILPRGVSIVGADLRKVIFRPKYVPAPFNNDVAPSSIFRMTGGNFFQGFTILDQHSKHRSGAPAYSHHKLSAFAFCKNQDLELYYNNVLVAFADRSIYNRAQDAANLLEKNVDWVFSRTIPTVYPLQNERHVSIFTRELRHFLFSLATDLRRLDKHNISAFAERFRSAHIDSLELNLRDGAESFYEILFRDTFDSVIDAINNQANRIEGGVVDERIIIDTSASLRCADVVSAIANYYDILSAILKADPSVALINDKFAISDSEVRDLETSIVIPSNSGNMNTVEGASPYIFSASVRSEYGMCGIDGNGADVGGLRSYLAAQFTIISLQRADDVFTATAAQDEVTGLRYKGSLATDATLDIPDCRHFGYRVRNGAYAQLVSCFCICPAVHYWADNGSEFSITNSTSNFGDISLYSEGFLPTSYPQDRDLLLAGIIKPADLPYVRNPDSSFADQFNLGTIFSVDNLGSNTLKITLSGSARYMDKYKIVNEGSTPTNRLNYVYVSSRTVNERRGIVQSVTLNDENKTEIIVSIVGSPGTWVWDPDNENVDATVIGRQLYISRFVDTRKAIDRQYRLIVRRTLPLSGKRKPPIHYVIQQNIAQGATQPFALDRTETRSCFYVLGLEDTDLLRNEEQECYILQMAAVNRDLLGNNEYEIDIDISSRINLDFDPSDPLLVGVLNKLNSASYENMDSFLDRLGVAVNLNVSTTRVIDITPQNIKLNFHKPSIIRCGGQTWEYMGYYNYSSAIPSVQSKKLGESLSSEALRKALRLAKTQTPLFGGRIYATGMDEEGNSYAGNSIIDLKTGTQEEIVRGTSPDVIAAIEQEEIILAVTYDNVTVDVLLKINGDVTGLPDARDTAPGIVRLARAEEVEAEEDDTIAVTPLSLKSWRIAKKIVSGKTTSNNIYVSNREVVQQDGPPLRYHSAAEPYRNIQNPDQGNVVSVADFKTNQETPSNEGQFWQLSDPAAPNFRCLGDLSAVADYGNENLTPNDQLVLFIDPGKYLMSFTFNFALVINGANNTGASGFGDPDGSDDKSVILYTRLNSTPQGAITYTVQYRNSPIIINAQAESRFQYVHFWTWVTAAKDLDTEWGDDKKKEESTIEQLLLNIDYRLRSHPFTREKYNGSWGGINRAAPVFDFYGSGRKVFRYVSFGGLGSSAARSDAGGFYGGGYITVSESCELRFDSIVFRGNEVIRCSDKRGRRVYTPVDPQGASVPSVPYRTEDSWSEVNGSKFVPVYNADGSFNTTCIAPTNTSNDYWATDEMFHDPFTEEWVTIGFCDRFIGVESGQTVSLVLGHRAFHSYTYFGQTTINTIIQGPDLNGVQTIGNDSANFRLERNTGDLFGTVDGRTVAGTTSAGQHLLFRGTDNLGRKVEELYPPVLSFVGGVPDPTNLDQEAEFNEWVDKFVNQGPTIRTFMESRYPITVKAFGSGFSMDAAEYNVWGSDIIPNGDFVRTSGYLGEFGYRLQTNNLKLAPILPHTLSPNYLGTTITWNTNGSKYVTGNQYHYNFFRPAWKGFRDGTYQHPVIIDIGADYTNLISTINSTNDFSLVAPFIIGMMITKGGQQVAIHTLNGRILGAIFILVGTTSSQALSVAYMGYTKTGAVIEHKFRLINSRVGVTNYFSAKSAGQVYNTIEELLGIGTVPPPADLPLGTVAYVKESNIFLTRTDVNGFNNGRPNPRSWMPVSLSPGYPVLHNLTNMGLFGNLYQRGLYVDKLGYETNSETNYGKLSSVPDNPDLRSGFAANTRFGSLDIFTNTTSDIIL